MHSTRHLSHQLCISASTRLLVPGICPQYAAQCSVPTQTCRQVHQVLFSQGRGSHPCSMSLIAHQLHLQAKEVLDGRTCLPCSFSPAQMLQLLHFWQLHPSQTQPASCSRKRVLSSCAAVAAAMQLSALQAEGRLHRLADDCVQVTTRQCAAAGWPRLFMRLPASAAGCRVQAA